MLLLTMPLNLKSLEVVKDEKLNVQAPECLKKRDREALGPPKSFYFGQRKEISPISINKVF